jgi:hypothetical protein
MPANSGGDDPLKVTEIAVKVTKSHIAENARVTWYNSQRKNYLFKIRHLTACLKKLDEDHVKFLEKESEKRFALLHEINQLGAWGEYEQDRIGVLKAVYGNDPRKLPEHA